MARQESEPQSGWVSKARVHRVIDGDTIEVEIVRRFAIRLSEPGNNNFDVAEKNTELGKEATQFVWDLLIPTGQEKEVTIFIPAGKNDIKLMDINSFNRLIGEVWVDGERLTDILRAKGYEKPKED